MMAHLDLLVVSRRWPARLGDVPSEAEVVLVVRGAEVSVGVGSAVIADIPNPSFALLHIRTDCDDLRPSPMFTHGLGLPVSDGRTAIHSPRNAEVATSHRKVRQRRLTASIAASLLTSESAA